MSHLRGFLGPGVVPLLAFVALADMGCATSIASKYPHLEQREICVSDIPGTEPEWTELIFVNGNVPISNLHPEVVDRDADKVRTVFIRNPWADPRNVRYLPAPFDQLECAPVFAMLPSRDEGTQPLPEAAVDLLVHEQRPERMPLAVAQKLATCPSPKVDEVPPVGFSLRFNVYVDEKNGNAVSALMRDSTLEDRNTEGCFVDVLRTTSWSLPGMTEPTTNAPEAATVSIGSKLFLADGPMQAPNLTELLRGAPTVGPPQAKPPTPFRLPFLGVFSLLGPALVGGTVFIGITLLPNELAPPWISELNPVTKRPSSNATTRPRQTLDARPHTHFATADESRRPGSPSPEALQVIRSLLLGSFDHTGPRYD